MLLSTKERRLCQILQDLPQRFAYRYSSRAAQTLQQAVFRSLVAENDEYLRVLFKGNLPKENEDWLLRRAQGMVEGAEYSLAARGKHCGHIFKSGEATYRCKTCTVDDTCVLCTRCFDASDHAGHVVYINISPGNTGCCDCGDEEAWRIPVNCAIHTADASASSGKQRQPLALPGDLLESIQMTVGRVIDYLCDVISCSPEQLRHVKTEESIRTDEEASHLSSQWYDEPESIDAEFALVLWNDEKHTVSEVKTQVARACKKTAKFGLDKANETNDIGRSVVVHSKNVQQLLKVAQVIEAIKITVTIRSSRDTFREQMCGTLIEWLQDISACVVGDDDTILRQTICEELLKPWQTGSKAANSSVGQRGIDDHEIEESGDYGQSLFMRAARRRNGIIAQRIVQVHNNDSDTNANGVDDEEDDDDEDDEDDEADDDPGSDIQDDEMAIDLEELTTDQDQDMEMQAPGELEDETEVSEATYAGYPPPPPPPPQAPRLNEHLRMFSDPEASDPLIPSTMGQIAHMEIPKTPWPTKRLNQTRSPEYWLLEPQGYTSREPVATSEDIRQALRLDKLIQYDLRLWKKARVDLRDLYIGTIVSVPQFRRILGLRFAALYTLLAELYLIADREPDHSIINLSLQMLTTPSITEEVVERSNFLTVLMAILYTFLTSRQVGHPWQVSNSATLAFDAGSVTNRRMYHFFGDLKHLFSSDYVQEKLRTEQRYVQQFLDLIRLAQGICPNVRAVGEHVEYETDAWISASLLTREMNKLCRQFAESFRGRRAQEGPDISRVIHTVAKATVINALGAERIRFEAAETKTETRFKELQPFEFDIDESGHAPSYSVVDFVVEKGSISFHHALHYTLSWLVDCSKGMSRDQLYSLLRFTAQDLRESAPQRALLSEHDPESYLLALFDFPLRVCAWLAQMKAGMWVRNGLSLRHQMSTYRGVSHRDLAHQRDIFLLQTAMVICDPSRVLASMIDRFGMEDWMRGTYVLRPGYEWTQLLDCAEDFIHLLIVLLSDRTSLEAAEDGESAQKLSLHRDITHILCFKPLSFSDLSGRLADKFTDLEEFQDVVDEMTIFRAPEGLSDVGTFELKPRFLEGIDPYIAHYTKNQRDEAENAYRTWKSKATKQPLAEVVLEPKLRPIKSGVFEDIAAFTRTSLFAQVIYSSLMLVLPPEIPKTRHEAFLQVVLHLALIAIAEDRTNEKDVTWTGQSQSFVHTALRKVHKGRYFPTIFSMLVYVLGSEDFKACHPRVRVILHRLQEHRPNDYAATVREYHAPEQLPASVFRDLQSSIAEEQEAQKRKSQETQEAKKRQALDRQARVMAQFQQQQQKFLESQMNVDWVEGDSDDMASMATGPTEEHHKMWKYPSGNCILCQEETNDSQLFGTFALIMNSNILRLTDSNDPDFMAEVSESPASLDRSAESIRPFGIAGKNKKTIQKGASDGRQIITEHQGLGKGFPPKLISRGPLSTGCGHVMHYSCFEKYCTATQNRQQHQIARNHPERPKKREFVCPLCKALGNNFLPIIWRGKEENYPGVLQTECPFDVWLHTRVALTVSRFLKDAEGGEGKSGNSRCQEYFVSYASKNVIPPLASRLTTLMSPERSDNTSVHSSQAYASSKPFVPGMFPNDDSPFMVSPSHPPSTDSKLSGELKSIYNRIRDSLEANGLAHQAHYPLELPRDTVDDLTHADTLAKALGFSISIAEISQRGTPSEPGSTLLEKMPSLALAHLRILSETTSSYIAIGGMRDFAPNNKSAREFSDLVGRQLQQLFGSHPQIFATDSETWEDLRLQSALGQDAFVFLAECSVCLVPALNIDILHLVRLCYLLEMVKIVIFLSKTDSAPWAQANVSAMEEGRSKEDLNVLRTFLHFITHSLNSVQEPCLLQPSRISERSLKRIYQVLSTYALPFLRKATILLHVRYGVDFPNSGFADIDDPELDRLTRALRLPSLPELLAHVGEPTAGNLSVSRSMVSGWIAHWKWSLDKNGFVNTKSTVIRPTHPIIYELIGLPRNYDTLTHEATLRRCRTTGKELTDPTLCLFCGDIFCSQATCCAKDNKGGANQHMEK